MPTQKVFIRGVSAVLLLATIGIFAWLQVKPQRYYYAELGQDQWVLEEVFPDETEGFFVDIGAWDAEVSSNTKGLEERGWNGLCVEPFPVNWKNRKCELFKEVAYHTAGEKIEFRTAGILGGVDKDIDSHKERVAAAPVVELETTTIGDILERGKAPPYIHYLSIDTEGSEYEILRVFPFDKYRVGAWTIEHNREEEKREQIRKLLTDHGYVRAKAQDVDDYYVDGSRE